MLVSRIARVRTAAPSAAPGRGAVAAHLAARAAGHRRRGRHERLHHPDRHQDGPPRHRRRGVHQGHVVGPAAGRRAGARGAGAARHGGPVRGARRATSCRRSCARSPRACCVPRPRHDPGYYDLVHSHYWLSGQVGFLARDRWGVPLVHSAHTLARVKNAALAAGDTPEPRTREIGEQQVVDEADQLIANTAVEAGTARRPLRRRRRTRCTRSRPASTSTCSGPVTARPPGPRSASRRTRWCSRSSAGSSR